MKQTDYKDLCQAVDAGEEKSVTHMLTRQSGKVLSCALSRHEMEIEMATGEHKIWVSENCLKGR